MNERVGDWVCIACENLNFSFRHICNRCWRDKNDKACVVLMSEEELEKFQKAGGAAHYLSMNLNNFDAAKVLAQHQIRPQLDCEVYSGLNSKSAVFKPTDASELEDTAEKKG